MTSGVGEYLFLSESDFSKLTDGTLEAGTELYRDLRTRQIVCDAERGPLLQGLAAQQRTRKHFATEDPALHILVLTLRCDHRCHYCQVSPRRPSERGFVSVRVPGDEEMVIRTRPGPSVILPIEGAPPIFSEGAEPDVLFRLGSF
ncbi:MAG: His-Xaa-Ser system radical SAM maturase HxsB, partial [Chloroflexi bacterium]|nr:His-Xaa-Ser system radical SAM maturase HxsB [Chloroflexota bacterium]